MFPLHTQKNFHSNKVSEKQCISISEMKICIYSLTISHIRNKIRVLPYLRKSIAVCQSPWGIDWGMKNYMQEVSWGMRTSTLAEKWKRQIQAEGKAEQQRPPPSSWGVLELVALQRGPKRKQGCWAFLPLHQPVTGFWLLLGKKAWPWRRRLLFTGVVGSSRPQVWAVSQSRPPAADPKWRIWTAHLMPAMNHMLVHFLQGNV